MILVSNTMQRNDTQLLGGPVWDEELPCAQYVYLQTDALIVTDLLSRLIGPHPLLSAVRIQRESGDLDWIEIQGHKFYFLVRK